MDGVWGFGCQQLNGLLNSTEKFKCKANKIPGQIFSKPYKRRQKGRDGTLENQIKSINNIVME